MIRHFRASALVAALVPVFFPLSLSAQQPAAGTPADKPACPVETMQPQPVGIAFLSRQKVVQATKPEDAQKAIKDAVKSLFDDKAKSNPNGRDLLLGQFFIFAYPYGAIQTRGALGMPGDPKANVDLIVAADSLFTNVEKAQPGCVAEIAQWREYKPYLELVQAAYKAISANQIDTAGKLASRALILSRVSPQPYDVLWRVAKAKNDEAGVLTNLKIAAEKLAGDTANAAVRENLLFNLGRLTQDFAEKKDKAAQAEANRAAVVPYMAVLAEYPASEEATFALGGISQASVIANDTAIARAAINLIKANPSKYSDGTLAQAGVMATHLNDTPMAISFFEAAIKANPYSRDYLYNFAAMLYEGKRATEMLPFVRKLVELDPNNPDNTLLFAYAFKGYSDVPDEKVKRIQKDSAAGFAKADLNGKKAFRDSLAAYRSVQKVFVDSVVHYSKVSDEMPERVTYTGFDRSKDRTVLQGMVENKGKAPRTFTINFEFLGKDGSVLAKQAATVSNVAPGGTGKFTVDIPVGGVLGVRYAPLPNS